MYTSENGIVSNRRVDTIRENNMKEELNEIYKNNGLTTIRIEDRERQIKGIDVLVKTDEDNWMKVDEKAATTRPTAYNTLLTFCFEVSADNNPDGTGWLFKPDSETTHFAIIYPLSHDNYKTLEAAEIFFIEKQAVLDYLWDLGIGRKEDVLDIINNSDSYDRSGRRFWYINDATKIAQSLQLAERPVNIIIDRGVLRRMAAKVINYQKAS